MTYPHICFSVDNFDEIFNEVTVRDGETIGIELTATDPKHESIVNTVLVNFLSGLTLHNQCDLNHDTETFTFGHTF